MNNRNKRLLVCLLLGAISLCYNGVMAQTPAPQSDLFFVLQGSCNEYLDVAANDRVNGQSYQLAVIAQPSHGSASVNGGYLVYCADTGYIGADLFTYQLTTGGNSAIATVYLNIRLANNYIFAGDADQNGRVEHFDVLSLGLAYNLTGPARTAPQANGALAWQPTPYTNNNPGAADCNGDGLVDFNDLAVIDAAYNTTYSYPPYAAVDTSICRNGMPLFLQALNGDSVTDGSTLDLSVTLGDILNPQDVYGIAFTLQVDTNFVGAGQVSFITSSSWLLQNDTGLFFSRSIQPTGEIEIALTKTDHINANGGGEALRARLPIDDNIDGIITSPGWHALNLKIKKARIISAYNIVQPVCIEEPNIVVYKQATGLANQPQPNKLMVYPNPAVNQLLVAADNIRTIELSDITGRALFTLSTPATNQAVIQLSPLNLATGNYLVRVQTNEFVSTRKIFVQH